MKSVSMRKTMMDFLSLPSWERGLKSRYAERASDRIDVAPLVGAWIEIPYGVGAVITDPASLPSWERGLKFGWRLANAKNQNVAPLVGAWIEII